MATEAQVNGANDAAADTTAVQVERETKPDAAGPAVDDSKLLTPNPDEGQPKQKIRKQSSLRFASRIVEVRDKKGTLQAAIPYVPAGLAWLCLFLNVFLPGTGTLLMALAALCGAKTSSKKPNKCLDCLKNFASGLLQIVTSVIIVGWVWSIYWGMYIVMQATESEVIIAKYGAEKDEKERPIYNPPHE